MSCKSYYMRSERYAYKSQIARDLSLVAVSQMLELTKAQYSVANMQGEDGFGLLTEDVSNFYSIAYSQIFKNIKYLPEL